MNSQTLCSADIVNLLLSTMGIGAQKNTDASQELINVAIKLENSVPQEYRQDIKNAREKFFCDYDPWFGSPREVRYIETIKKAVLKHKKLRITYKKHKGDASERVIMPYGAVIKDSEWYLAAFCETRQEVRAFRCSRIIALEILEEDFSMPKDFSLKEFWQNSKQKFMSKAFVSETLKLYPVEIKFWKEEKALAGFHVISCSKNNEYTAKVIDMPSFETACSILFPLSHEVEILEPKELREYILRKAESIISLYNMK